MQPECKTAATAGCLRNSTAGGAAISPFPVPRAMLLLMG
jgi:hypothetical protein